MVTKGYNETFIGEKLVLPIIDKTLCAPRKDGNGHEIKYTHYSSFQHKDRKLPIFTAVNIKGEDYKANTRAGGEPWDSCEQIEEKFQLKGQFYSNDDNTFDRGHLVRRVDPCWGSNEVADLAELETFRWTNCVPQHRKLNRDGGIWYQLEQHVMEHGVKNKIADISVFAGPVLDEKDKLFIKQYEGSGVKIPITYWKVITWKKTDHKIYAVGFMMSQWEWIKDKVIKEAHAIKEMTEKKPLPDDYFENLKFSDHKTYQVPVKDIEKATGIHFNWPGVVFPYQGKEYTKITAKELANPYEVGALHKHYQLAKTKDASLEKEKLYLILNENSDKSKNLVNEIQVHSKGFLPKKYELLHITL